MSEPTLPPAAQKAAVLELLAADNSKKKIDAKLSAIEAAHPQLAAGVKAVREEGANPKMAGSGSAAIEPLRLADIV